ncbi:Six-hairpin glycosidase-like protein [Xylariales sp. PMI_506]|nr:Six-hairpin glycosidase-like protein [Xylariales sp. PMI_506]
MKACSTTFLCFAVAQYAFASPSNGIDYHKLPNRTVFPGPWDEYIKAPSNKAYIVPKRIWKVDGNVTTTTRGGAAWDGAEAVFERGSILIGEGGLLTVEFEENISGRVCFDLESSADQPVVKLAFSESHLFVEERSDATNDEEWDLPLDLHIGNQTGKVCVGPEYIRGAFKYLTVYIDVIPVFSEGRWASRESSQSALGEREPYSKPSIGISQLWVNCSSFPSQTNGRAYSGYFYSSSTLLNRIWYAGAYTLQLSTIDPKEGSALIPVNRNVDHNNSPAGSWYSNFTVSPGTTVTTDGAKRDRLVWPGDMYIAIPGIAVSTYDMLAVRNALDILYDRQYSDGRLPYAGPPLSYRNEFSDTYHLHTLLGTYFYVLYSGDVAWLREKWPAYLKALQVSTSKIDASNLMRVTSPFDWNRHGMEGHNIEANAILYEVLQHSIELASFMDNERAQTPVPTVERADVKLWTSLRHRLQQGVESLYCSDTDLFSDNLDDRHCMGPHHVDPQDGNSWVLIAGIYDTSSEIPLGVSRALRVRWTRFGAPAPEFPNVMSPFSSSFELQGHCAAGNHDAAVELMLLMWGYLLDGPGFTNSTLAEGFRTDGDVHYPAYPIRNRNSHAHGWAAGPTSTLSTSILGIKLLSPAGVDFHIAPVLTSWLGWARGGFAVRGGQFEVMLWRVLLRNTYDGDIARKGTVAVVRYPSGSRGSFSWGDESSTTGFKAPLVGGQIKAWVRWETGPNLTQTDELNLGAWLDSTTGNSGSWFDQSIPYGEKQTIVYDYTFKEPIMTPRQPGEVDFQALEMGYIKSSKWMKEASEDERIGEL